MMTENRASERSSDALATRPASYEDTSDREIERVRRLNAPKQEVILSRAKVLTVLGPLLISIEGVNPAVAHDANLYNLGIHDVARALLALPDDAKSPLEESD